MMKKQFANMLSQEMDRKEFLRYTGIALLMLAGGGAIMQAIGSMNRTRTPERVSVGSSGSYGYGASSYGGKTNPL